jgi:hypothetical protein
MRSGLHPAGGFAAGALLLLGVFAAFELTRPPATVPGALINWEGAPTTPAPVARPLVAVSAARRSLPPLEKNAPQPEVGPLGAAVPGEARPMPAGAVAAADAFRVRLEPSPQTPHGYAYADTLRAALARQGAVAARRSGRVIWSVDHEFVARLDDGARIAITGGYGVTELSFRKLTPDTCKLLFGAAEGARAYLTLPGGAVLRPPGLWRGGWTYPVTVTDANALCARLGPAFAAWRRDAPAEPLDLHDLDRRGVSIASQGGDLDPGQPAPARQAVFY